MRRDGWSEFAIGDFVAPVRTTNPSKSFGAETFDYVDVGAVDPRSKSIARPTRLRGIDAPSRARQVIATGDILVSTVRPNLNTVARVGPAFDGAIASTGFAVLRPGSALDGDYLFHWVKGPCFVAEMVRRATGASYPAVSDRIVRESSIPLPALPEQRRVAHVLDLAERLRARCRRSLELIDRLTSAFFMERFGEPGANPHGWTRRPVSAFVSAFEGGKSFAGQGETEAEGAYRVLRVSAVTSGEFRCEESRPVPLDYRPPTRHLVKPGDLLISRANTSALVGAVALVDQVANRFLLPDKIWRFRWRDETDVVPEFVWQLFRTPAVRAAIARRATGTSGSMKNISAEKLMGIEVIQPPVPRQRDFAEVVRQCRLLRMAVVLQMERADALFASLEQRAFAGEL